jgi:erythromycin esterase
VLASALGTLVCTEGRSSDLFSVWAKTTAIRIRGTSPDQDAADFKPLRKMIDDARIVAVGESRHDLHEQFQFKHRMVRFLVQQMSFSAVAMEVSMPDAGRVNDYVSGGAGDAEQLVHDSLGYWDAWDTEEILALVQWLRQYNVDPAHGRKVHFYGFDMMFPSSSVAEIIRFLEKVDADHAAAFRQQTAHVRTEPQRLSRKEWMDMRDALSKLRSDVEANRREYSARSSRDAFEWALHQISVATQAANWWLAGADGLNNRAQVREQSMAENIQWILQHEGPHGRILVSAHNAHVAKGYRRKPEGVALGSPIEPMGKYLNRVFGASLIVLAATFNQGRLQAVGPFKERTFAPALDDSLDGELRQVQLPFFILDLRTVPRRVRQDSPREWKIRANVGSGDDGYDVYTAPDSFDAVYFIDEVSRSRPNPLALAAWRNRK